MNNQPAVSVQNLSKLYYLYKRPQDRLKQSLFHRFGKNYARLFWALSDVSFELERGRALGIVGRNGSGKSTLLQIVCGTLQPTNGTVQVNGRVTALLELGAGFNPEFTGRENIFLNGATLNISNQEMRRKLDQIIDFAQIGEFIDQPVKMYSSGMYVRLAFAIATSVDPDVLVIDEALAVGDAGFVIKCMNRIKQLRANGATVLLVTHDVQTARSICDEVIWLDGGKVRSRGATLQVTSEYMQFLFGEQPNLVEGMARTGNEQVKLLSRPEATSADAQRPLLDLTARADLVRWGSGEIQVEGFSVETPDLSALGVLEHGRPVRIEFQLRAGRDVPSTEIGLAFAIRNTRGLDLVTSTTYDEGRRLPPLRAGQRLRVSFEMENLLAPGDYALVLNIEDRAQGSPRYYDFVENAALIKVISSKLIHSLVLPEVKQDVWFC